jgi:hypothetical protein
LSQAEFEGGSAASQRNADDLAFSQAFSRSKGEIGVSFGKASMISL